MTQWNEIVRSLGRHDSGDARSCEHVPFLRVAFKHRIECMSCHVHAALGNGYALGWPLCRHIDHSGIAGSSNVSELGRERHGSLRGANLRPSKEGPCGRCHIASAHEAFADEECRNAHCRKLVQIGI